MAEAESLWRACFVISSNRQYQPLLGLSPLLRWLQLSTLFWSLDSSIKDEVFICISERWVRCIKSTTKLKIAASIFPLHTTPCSRGCCLCPTHSTLALLFQFLPPTSNTSICISCLKVFPGHWSSLCLLHMVSRSARELMFTSQLMTNRRRAGA